jgi:hypothetical protein
MRAIYVTAPPNQLTAHNIKVSSVVTIGKTRLNHHYKQHHDEKRHFFVSLAFTSKYSMHHCCSKLSQQKRNCFSHSSLVSWTRRISLELCTDTTMVAIYYTCVLSTHMDPHHKFIFDLCIFKK